MTRQLRSFALSTLTLAAGLAWAPAHAVSYQVIDLGTLAPGGTSIALGLNNVGQVVGVTNVFGQDLGFVWSAATGMRSVLGSAGSPNGYSANGINDSGTIVGTQSFGSTGAAFVKQPTGAAVYPLTGYLSDGTGINASGQIVGATQIVASGPVFSYITPALVLGSTTTYINAALGGNFSGALAVNDLGHVVGQAQTRTGALHAYMMDTNFNSIDLGSLGGSSRATALNRNGQVVGLSYDADGRGRAFLWDATNGMRSIGTLARDSRATGINDAGQVVGWADASSQGTPVGAFVYGARDGMIDLNSRLSTPGAARITFASAINQAGDIVGQNANQRAVLLRPGGDLAWQGANGARFSEASNWELGFAPDARFDAQIYTAGLQNITLDRDTTVNSLGLGGATGGRPTLLLADGNTLTATYGVTVRATGTLTGDGRVTGAVLNQGTVLASNLRIDGALTNQGLVGTRAGVPGRLATDLDNQGAGQMRVGSAEVMVLSGASHRNSGTIEVRGGELELNGTLGNETGGRVLVNGGTLRFNDGLANRGEVNIGFNGAEIFGRVVQGAGGRLVLSGRSNTTFYGAVDIGAASELRVSAGATALFFGAVQQRSGALFTGTGTKFYEGGLSVGASPGLGTDEGSVVFGGSSLYLAEIGGTTAGSGFDKLVVAGDLHFGGALKLVSWAGFAAQAGQRFDLFDWGSTGGSFSSIDASGLALADGLVLDTSQLYVDGSVGVVPVPEPASWALALAGLLVVARVARRRD